MKCRLPLYLLVTFCGSQQCVKGSENNAVDDLVVETSTGPVRGKIVLGFTNKQARVFFGIPYADPPIGKLRFRPPLPVKPWTEVFDAIEKPLPCYQFYTRQSMEDHREAKTLISRPWSEDCLKLNIWTAHPVTADSPVLVLFHSGRFSTGSSTFPYMDGSTLAAEAANVIVSLNYRLGPFGFLSYGTDEAPGNVGLVDQQVAMRWIHRNIHKFGGKTKAIILVGTGGAGSASVGYHVIAESSYSLFRTATIFAGSPTCPFAYQTKGKALKQSKTLAEKVGCSRENLDEEIECLREAHPEDIVHAEKVRREHKADQFKPTEDGTFITESPIDSMKGGRFNKKVTIIGTTNPDEGTLIFARVNRDLMTKPEEGITIEAFRKSIKRLFPHLPQSALDAIEEAYVGTCASYDPIVLRNSAMRVYSDHLIDCCMNDFLELASKYGTESYRCVEELPKASSPSWQGSYHGISMVYALGYPQAAENQFGFNTYEANISVEYIKWIEEFSQKKTTALAEIVPVYDEKDRSYIFWNYTHMFVSHNYRQEHCDLLQTTVPLLQALGQRTCEEH